MTSSLVDGQIEGHFLVHFRGLTFRLGPEILGAGVGTRGATATTTTTTAITITIIIISGTRLGNAGWLTGPHVLQAVGIHGSEEVFNQRISRLQKLDQTEFRENLSGFLSVLAALVLTATAGRGLITGCRGRGCCLFLSHGFLGVGSLYHRVPNDVAGDVARTARFPFQGRAVAAAGAGVATVDDGLDIPVVDPAGLVLALDGRRLHPNARCRSHQVVRGRGWLAELQLDRESARVLLERREPIRDDVFVVERRATVTTSVQLVLVATLGGGQG